MPSTVRPVTRPAADSLERLLDELVQLRSDVEREGRATFERWQPDIRRRAFLISGRNLANYLALRRRDLRAIQTRLMPLGLSSLGRCEARVMPNLDSVIAALEALTGRTAGSGQRIAHHRFFRGERLLRAHTSAIFGPQPGERSVRIMVTLPTEAATEYGLVRDLVNAGMDCARINCAHDQRLVWSAMTENVRRAARETGRNCKLYFDIAGPKVRTGDVAEIAEDTRVKVGDRVAITRDAPVATETVPIAFTSTIPAVLSQIRPGQAVWINDGRIGCVVESVGDRAVLRVTSARPKGERIRPDKGLNFPDSDLRIGALTDKDLDDLKFTAGVADILGYSFVREPADVKELQRLLHGLTPNADRIAIALKIENAKAVRALPELIVTVASRQPAAVMIARGDLAVEIGYRRLAEIQEEILWLCEAAHVPVIWATAVLDNFIKKGVPSRAEFTDAAMAERADCVMLNKGPYITEAVTVLADVLSRMEGHQVKKTSRLRALRSW